MIEMLGGAPGPSNEVEGPAIFLFDTNTGADSVGLLPYTLSTVGSLTYDAANPIHGARALSFPTSSAGMTITLTDILDLSGDWTYEFSMFGVSAPSAYAAETTLFNNAGAVGFHSRYGDSGFSNLFQFGPMTTVDNAYSCRFNKAYFVNRVTDFAWVCKNGRIRFYCDGKLELLRTGTSGNFTLQDFATLATMNAIKSIRVGYATSTVAAFPSRRGKIRLSKFARYLGNYTPKPF